MSALSATATLMAVLLFMPSMTHAECAWEPDENGNLVMPPGQRGIPGYRSWFGTCTTPVVSVDFAGSDISTVGHSAFSGLAELRSVSFTNSRGRTVMSSAFASCRNLTSVSFANSSVLTLYQSSFEGCSGLRTVNFTNSSIGTIFGGAFVRQASTPFASGARVLSDSHAMAPAQCRHTAHVLIGPCHPDRALDRFVPLGRFRIEERGVWGCPP